MSAYILDARGVNHVVNSKGEILVGKPNFATGTVEGYFSPQWKLYGLASRWNGRPIRFEELKEKLDRGEGVEGYVYDIDHGTMRMWGGSYGGKLPKAKMYLSNDLRVNPPFYAHNLYEKKTHGLNLKQMRRLYAMVSRGNKKAITFARNVLGIPFSESPSQVKAVVLHHVRDLAERRVRRNPARSHRERIAIDTVRHPMKGYFLGGPDLAESVRYLRSLGYSMAQLKKLNPEVEDILEGRKSILPNRRVGRNPFGGETLRSFKQKYKGFEIIVEIQPNTILATWTNGDILASDRFSGYELEEIFEEVKARIDALKRRRK